MLNPKNVTFNATIILWSPVRQSEFDGLCNSERGWAFERVVNAALDGYDHKRMDAVESRAECARLCLTEEEFDCRSEPLKNREVNLP